MWTNEANVTTPYSYVKHINFINFEEFGRTNPIYINFVRHPIGIFTYIFQAYIRKIEIKKCEDFSKKVEILGENMNVYVNTPKKIVLYLGIIILDKIGTN